MRPLAVSAPCPLCGNSMASTAYTATGEVARSVGHDGRITFFTYDSRGRETQRAEFSAAYNTATTRPALSAAERVVTTQWHATWNLPLQRSEPGSIQWWTYSSKGQVLTERRQATTDPSGATGLAALKTGVASGRTFSYTTTGLQATAAEVLDTSVSASWTYTYNAQGDPTRVVATEAGVSSTADLTSSAQGQLTRLAASNGAFTTFSYAARGQLVQAQLPDLMVGIAYDARRQVQRLDYSTGQSLSVAYDAAGMPLRVVDGPGVATPLASLAAEGLTLRVAAVRKDSTSSRRARWTAWLPVPEVRAQAPNLVPLAITRGIGAIPADQVRPFEPDEAGPGGPGCCAANYRLTPEQMQRLFRQAASGIGLLGARAADEFDLRRHWLITWRQRSDLRKNLLCDPTLADMARNGCYEAHHIVAWSDPRAGLARAKLLAVKVDLNSIENGVLLECDKHRGLHTTRYYQAVDADLSGASTREQVVDVLEAIRGKIRAGAYPG